MLGAIAVKTERLDIATGVTCPIIRYHPAIIAQAAATVACLTDRQFTLGVGSGERLNEHITGAQFPAVDLRQEMLKEAIHAMRLLWSGDWTTFRGRHFTVEDTRIYDLPAKPIQIVVAISGPDSLRTAQESDADGIMTVEPLPALVQRWNEEKGGSAGTWAEITFAWAPTREKGLNLAHERFRFGIQGWKVMAELPNPVNFAASCSSITPEDIGRSIPHGPDPESYLEALHSYLDAGAENISVVPAGDDLGGFSISGPIRWLRR